MTNRVSIALASPVPDERACVMGWLAQAGYDPVGLHDFARLDECLQTHAVQALLADRSLVPADDVMGLVRRLGSNRPLLVLGASTDLPGASQGEVSVIDRPLTRDALLLSVGLALAEGRPARKFPRRFVQALPASAHGVGVTVYEASAGGVGLELAGPRPTVLPPYFDLRIPEYGVHVLVKRAWMAPVATDIMRCGGTVEGNLPGATRRWSEFAREAPALVGFKGQDWSYS